MKITLEYPEFCLLSSIALALNGHPIYSYVLLGFSLLLGLGRAGLKAHKAQQENEQLESAFGKVKDTILKMATAGGLEDFSTRH